MFWLHLVFNSFIYLTPLNNCSLNQDFTESNHSVTYSSYVHHACQISRQSEITRFFNYKMFKIIYIYILENKLKA